MLTPCPACNRFVRETTCPFCGAAVIHPRFVRRPIGHATRAMIAFGTAAATTAILPLAGCSDDGRSPNAATDATSNQDAPHYATADAYGIAVYDASPTGAGAYGAVADGAVAFDAGHDATADEAGDVDSGDAGDQ